MFFYMSCAVIDDICVHVDVHDLFNVRVVKLHFTVPADGERREGNVVYQHYPRGHTRYI